MPSDATAKFSGISFGSDNHSAVHPRVLEWIAKVNDGTVSAYGTDAYTRDAADLVKAQFGPQAEVFFVWNGSAANVLGLQSAVRSHQAIVCSDVAHIHLDECGAPEHHLGAKLLTVASQNGKISLLDVRGQFARRHDVHAVQPKVISLTQATEYGTVYTLDEIRALGTLAREHDAYLHMDGARAANAAVSLGCSLRAMTTDTGVDILSLGGTKNGLLGAEAVVILNPQLAAEFPYIRKQGLHLASKMRFLSAQFLAYFEDDLWRHNAAHANAMAQRLAQALAAVPDFQITQPVQANAVFGTLPRAAILALQQEFSFYVWNEALNEVRLMCSFATTESQIERFAARAARIWASADKSGKSSG
jgi:threonine aldolase